MNDQPRSGEAVGTGGSLYAGLGYSETKGSSPKKQARGRWFKERKPGICGVPKEHFIDNGVNPRKQIERQDNRHVPEPVEALESAEEEFHHSGWNVRRRRVMVALADSGASPAVVSRFRNCGSRAWVWRNKHDGRVVVRADYCRSRFCVRCAARVACRARASIAELVESGEPRLVTLTIPHSRGDALTVLVSRLLAAFKVLRRDEAWGLRVRGGAYVLEIKYNHQGGGWHPHLHVVCDASFLPVKQLGDAWRRAAGGGDFNVKRVEDKSGVARYVAKYVTKQFDGSVFHHPDRLLEAVRALKGTRTLGTFGAWRGVELVGEKEEFDKDAWKPLCRLIDVLALASDGDAAACRILRNLGSSEEQLGEGSNSGSGPP